jgi:hypothetical protein
MLLNGNERIVSTFMSKLLPDLHQITGKDGGPILLSTVDSRIIDKYEAEIRGEVVKTLDEGEAPAQIQAGEGIRPHAEGTFAGEDGSDPREEPQSEPGYSVAGTPG